MTESPVLYVLLIPVAALLLGLAVRRWRLLGVLFVAALLFAIGYGMFGHETDDLSVAGVIFWTLVPLAVLVLPATVVGIWLGRLVRRPGHLVPPRRGA